MVQLSVPLRIIGTCSALRRPRRCIPKIAGTDPVGSYSWIRKWFDIDYSPYTVKQGSYQYPTLEWKRAVLGKITGFKEVTVCEDETNAYEYWKADFNPNPDDCCNLRVSK